MRRTAGADPGGIEGIPLAAGAQHEENGVHGGAIVHPRSMTPERVGLSRWQERLDPLPQGIRDAPSPVKRIVRLNRAVLDRRVGLVLHCWDSDDNKIRSSKYRQIEPIGIGSKS